MAKDELSVCPECDSDDFRSVTHRVTRDLGDGFEILADVKARRCAGCHRIYIGARALTELEDLMVKGIVESGIKTAAAFRFLRKKADLRAADLADLLGVTPTTISRWERAKGAIDRSAFMALAQLALDRIAGTAETIERLKNLRRPPRRRVHIRMTDAA